MREGMIKVTLSEKSFSMKELKEWEQPCHVELPELLQAMSIIRQSINDYLTQLIHQHRDFVSGDLVDLPEPSEMEEEVKDDEISGFIKHMNNIKVKPGRQEQRKDDYLNQAKKVKK